MLFGVQQRMPEGFASTDLRLQELGLFTNMAELRTTTCKAAFTLVAFLLHD